MGLSKYFSDTIFMSQYFAFHILHYLHVFVWDCRGRDRIVVFTSTVQSVPITTKCASSNSVHGEVYLIQHYVIKSVSVL